MEEFANLRALHQRPGALKDIRQIKGAAKALEASELCNTLFLEDLLKKDMLYTENPFIPS